VFNDSDGTGASSWILGSGNDGDGKADAITDIAAAKDGSSYYIYAAYGNRNHTITAIPYSYNSSSQLWPDSPVAAADSDDSYRLDQSGTYLGAQSLGIGIGTESAGHREIVGFGAKEDDAYDPILWYDGVFGSYIVNTGYTYKTVMSPNSYPSGYNIAGDAFTYKWTDGSDHTHITLFAMHGGGDSYDNFVYVASRPIGYSPDNWTERSSSLFAMYGM